MQIHNVQALKPRRKELRSTMTPAEIRLWQALKHSQIDGLKFRRQPSIGPFIADFYCPAAKLVIELDGSVHDSEAAQQQDAERTTYLVSLGLRVVRFENREVMANLEGVLCEVTIPRQSRGLSFMSRSKRLKGVANAAPTVGNHLKVVQGGANAAPLSGTP